MGLCGRDDVRDYLVGVVHDTMAYLCSLTWERRRRELIQRAGLRCTYAEERNEDWSERCQVTTRLRVYPLQTGGLSTAPETAFEVLCPRHAALVHLQRARCYRCGGQIAEDDGELLEQIDALIQSGITDDYDLMASAASAQKSLCSYCDHMTHKDD